MGQNRYSARQLLGGSEQRNEPLAMDNLEFWTKKISQHEMPAFSRAAQELATAIGDDARHRSALSNIILQDAGLTAKVLRLANSYMFNPRGVEISTVSRAVLVLGENGIRDVSLAVVLVDSLLKGKQKENLKKIMGRAFYAATLASDLAEVAGDRSVEEVFVATLLHRLGEMTFTAFGGEKVPELSEARAKNNGNP